MFCGGVGSDGEAGNAHFWTCSLWVIWGIARKTASNSTFHVMFFIKWRMLARNQPLHQVSGSMCSSPALKEMCSAVRLVRGRKKRGLFLVISIWITQISSNSEASSQPSGPAWQVGTRCVSEVTHYWARGRSQMAACKPGTRGAASGEWAATALATKEVDWGRGKSTLGAWTSQPACTQMPAVPFH